MRHERKTEKQAEAEAKWGKHKGRQAWAAAGQQQQSANTEPQQQGQETKGDKGKQRETSKGKHDGRQRPTRPTRHSEFCCSESQSKSVANAVEKVGCDQKNLKGTHTKHLQSYPVHFHWHPVLPSLKEWDQRYSSGLLSQLSKHNKRCWYQMDRAIQTISCF